MSKPTKKAHTNSAKDEHRVCLWTSRCLWTSTVLSLLTLGECMHKGWFICFPCSHFKDSSGTSSRVALASWYLSLSTAALIYHYFNSAAFWCGEAWKKGRFSKSHVEESFNMGWILAPWQGASFVGSKDAQYSKELPTEWGIVLYTVKI